MNCYRCATPVPDKARYCFACGADVSGDTAQGMHPLERDPELEEKLAEDVKGEFVIERLLGRGGMAVVFLARDLQLDRKVAIKVLPLELTHGKGGLVERFKREARTAATLDHPNIVPIYRISKSGKLFWFAMKFIVGESLSEVLEREKRLPPDRSAAILDQVADALEFAHQHAIIHRDVKPANVMMDRNGRITVTDFGIAKAVGVESLTSSAAIVGTPSYMSPEQCSCKPVGAASDQYSLGVMAYQMLSGQLPFTGTATVDLIKQHCFDPPPPLDVVRAGLPPGLANVVERALAKTPEDRFASVTDFAAAFAALARLRTPTTIRQPRLRARAAAAPRGRRWKIVGGVGALTAIGLVGALLWRGKGELTPPPPPASPASAAGFDSAAAQRLAALPPPVAAAQAETTRTVKLRQISHQARLFLRGVSDGATVTLDGRPVHDSILLLRPGRHEITVTKPGFGVVWADTLWADAGNQLARWVVSRAAAPVPPVLVAAPESTPRASIPPPDAVLRVLVQPPARIAIDKVDFGEQRTLVRTVAGGAAHLISIVPMRAGYARKDTTVTPRPGDTVTVRIRLEESP